MADPRWTSGRPQEWRQRRRRRPQQAACGGAGSAWRRMVRRRRGQVGSACSWRGGRTHSRALRVLLWRAVVREGGMSRATQTAISGLPSARPAAPVPSGPPERATRQGATATELAPGWIVHDSGVGDHVAMRPVREDDLPVLEALTWDPETAGEF